MNKNEFAQYLDERLAEMPNDILRGSVQFLKNEFTPELIKEIKAKYTMEGADWIAGKHHTWGMQVRNKLREAGFKDDMLPTKNWDEYYVQVVEIACGIRKMPGGE
jgi:hypothetical protein